jgi:hypothetical protein
MYKNSQYPFVVGTYSAKKRVNTVRDSTIETISLLHIFVIGIRNVKSDTVLFGKTLLACDAASKHNLQKFNTKLGSN